MQGIDPAATAWLLASTALVLLMTPGLAIFYGGMVRTTGVLNMIMMSFISIPLVTVAWLVLGYSLSFSDGGNLVGNLEHFGMLGISPRTNHGTVPELLFATFELTFAIITAALISGAIADRAKFSAWMVFVPIWTIVVYSVIAHWVWAPQGWLNKFGSLDYAGGLVVEIASGSSALALAIVLGPRIGFKQDAMRPHNLPFVLLGVGLLWFGWFGFNAGSALAVDGTAAAIFLNTLVAGCLGMLGWLTVEQIRDGKPTTFGAASGVVAGLVAITPSCGYVNTLGALIVGLAAGVVCSFAVGLKFRWNYDDSLDVVGVHFVGGVVGVPLTLLLIWLDPPSGFRSAWWWLTFGPFVVYQIGQMFDDYILTPRIQGKATDLDTPSILFASITGGVLAGLLALTLVVWAFRPADLDPETRRWAIERCTPHPIAAMQAPVRLERFWDQPWKASVIWCIILPAVATESSTSFSVPISRSISAFEMKPYYVGGGSAHALRTAFGVEPVIAAHERNHKTKYRGFDKAGHHIFGFQIFKGTFEIRARRKTKIVNRDHVAAEHADNIAGEHEKWQHE